VVGVSDESQPLAGYLGSDARITKRAASELVEAGYSLELGDAPLLQEGLIASHLAHVVALSEAEVVPAADQQALLSALLDLASSPPDQDEIDPRYGDLYNWHEHLLEARVGAAAGWLSAGRARREAGRIAFRIALRGLLLEMFEATNRLAEALVDAAQRYQDLPMPDYSYLQVAQVTTFGHYILSFAFPALRDAERIRRAHKWVNQSPAGVGATAGTRYPLDRERLAGLLAFEAPIPHSRDAMWQTDGIADIGLAATSAVVNCSRLAEDLEIFASDEFAFIELDEEMCRASVAMPQKRNPYAIPVIRGAAGLLLGRLTGLIALQKTPSARTDNLIYAYGETTETVATATSVLALAGIMIRGMRARPDRMVMRVEESFAAATDVAEAIGLHLGIDYRTAYRIVGRAVAATVAEGDQSLSAEGVREAANDVLGHSVDLPNDLLEASLSAEANLTARGVVDTGDRAEFSAMLSSVRREIACNGSWITQRRRTQEALWPRLRESVAARLKAVEARAA